MHPASTLRNLSEILKDGSRKASKLSSLTKSLINCTIVQQKSAYLSTVDTTLGPAQSSAMHIPHTRNIPGKHAFSMAGLRMEFTPSILVRPASYVTYDILTQTKNIHVLYCLSAITGTVKSDLLIGI